MSTSTSAHASNGASQRQLVETKVEKLDLNTSATEQLQLARVFTRTRQEISVTNYSSDKDASDADSEDGCLRTDKYYHDNGNQRYFRTYQSVSCTDASDYDRMVEEKHFDIDGVCRVDVHFALGQPYLSRKHYWPNQRLKSEALFYIDDERTLTGHKTGYWRTYYPSGNVQSEMQYKDGIRYGFCKRYDDDGTIKWVKDYTKTYLQRIDQFHDKKESLSLSIKDAYSLLGFDTLPASVKQLNSQYRSMCAPCHPDKSADPDATDKFISLSRARDILEDYIQKHSMDIGSTEMDS